ncbi:hypothetical protein Fmac_025560 [Flemingia macrophylla]|uniref:Uncharacterized protein n=1 Tax=Flemingia macrophylla TaxID=520843 RepID=A0ABD1LSK0_9FABA
MAKMMDRALGWETGCEAWTVSLLMEWRGKIGVVKKLLNRAREPWPTCSPPSTSTTSSSSAPSTPATSPAASTLSWLSSSTPPAPTSSPSLTKPSHVSRRPGTCSPTQSTAPSTTSTSTALPPPSEPPVPIARTSSSTLRATTVVPCSARYAPSPSGKSPLCRRWRRRRGGGATPAVLLVRGQRACDMLRGADGGGWTTRAHF